MPASTRFSMAGDDCSLHFNLDELTPKQREDHLSNQVLTAMLQVALLYIAKSEDEVCLYDLFMQAPWAEALLNYHRLFAAMGLRPAPPQQLRYHPVDDFYASVAASVSTCEAETLYMVSGSNLPLHNNEALLTVSKNLNSKVHFAAHAPAFGLPVPETLHCTKAALDSHRVAAFFAQHQPPLMLKTLGLAGARNVTTVNSVAEAADYLAEYDSGMDVILQQRLRTEDYTEMTVDLFVSDTDIHVTNVRQIMFADGLWVGNLMGNAVRLPAHHEQALLQVGEYARNHGYHNSLGFNLGIDYFIRNPQAEPTLPEMVVTEINARWTGGLFPAELARRLGVQDQPVVAFIDMCPPQHFNEYQRFLERHLYSEISTAAFNIAPMGFAPFRMNIDGADNLFVWQVVIGSFDAFKRARAGELADSVLVTAPNITTGL